MVIFYNTENQQRTSDQFASKETKRIKEQY